MLMCCVRAAGSFATHNPHASPSVAAHIPLSPHAEVQYRPHGARVGWVGVDVGEALSHADLKSPPSFGCVGCEGSAYNQGLQTLQRAHGHGMGRWQGQGMHLLGWQ